MIFEKFLFTILIKQMNPLPPTVEYGGLIFPLAWAEVSILYILLEGAKG
jgi:hypothetical protein